MKNRITIARLFVEIALIIGISEVVAMFLLPVVAPNAGRAALAVLDAGMLACLAGPLVLWRVHALIAGAATAGTQTGTAEGNRRVAVVAGLALLGGLIVTALATTGAVNQVRTESRMRFERLTERVARSVEDRVSRAAYGLRAGRGVYAASVEVRRANFEAYVRSRELALEFPGATGFGVIERVERQNLAAFVARERGDGAPDFAVRDLSAEGDAQGAAGGAVGGAMYVVRHCFPEAGNRRWWGVDLGSIPEQREAIERAIDTGEAMISPRLKLAEGDSPGHGFVFVLPVYRDGTDPRAPADRRLALEVVLFAPVLFEHAVAGVGEIAEDKLDVEVYEGETATPAGLVFDYDQQPSALWHKGMEDQQIGHRLFTAETALTIGGRPWTLVTSTMPKFELGVEYTLPAAIGVGGVLLSLLSAGFVHGAMTTHQRVLATSRRMTSDLARAKQEIEAALRETSAFRGALDQHTIISVTDARGRIIEANPPFCAVSGYALEELLGQDHRMLNSGHHPKSFWVEMWRTLASGRAWRGQICNRAKDGSLYWVDSIIAPFMNAEGKIERYVSIRNDITAQKRAEENLRESERRLRSIFEADPECVKLLSPDGRLVEMNPAGLAMVEAEGIEQVRSCGLAHFVLPAYRPAFEALHERAAAGEDGSLVFECEGLRGTRRWLEINTRVLRDDQGRLTGFLGVSRDITKQRKAELALQESERKARAVFEQSYQYIGVLSTDGTLLDVNNSALEFAQVSRELVVGRPFWDTVWWRHSPALQAQVRESIRRAAAGEFVRTEVIVPDGRGELHVVDFSLKPIVNEEGRVELIIPEGRDITELRRTTERLEEAQVVAKMGNWTFDLLSGQVTWSSHLYQLFGRRPEDGPPDYAGVMADYEPESARRLDEAVRKAATEGTPYTLELRTSKERPAARYIRGEGRARRDASGRVVALYGTATDITAEVENAEVLRQAREQAEAASRAKSSFLANMSHEIRTPLTAIFGYSDMLREDGETGSLPAHAAQAIEAIRNASRHLMTVLNDILDLSKIEAEQMRVERVPTPVVAIVREVADLMKPPAAGKGIALAAELASPVPEQVVSDPTRLRQILMNLVGNAVKFTEHGRVMVRLGRQGHDSVSRLVIDVEDTGPGMDWAQSKRLFMPFSQADETVTRRHGGTGLGLTICRRLARLMGGEVTLLRSEPGQGSCFRLTLPFEPVEGTAMVERLAAPPTAEQGGSRAASGVLRGRVLLAEDGPDNQRLISFHLRRAGAKVSTAENGRIALEMIERAEAEGQPFDLLLTDMQMPEMDGYTLTRTLRARGSKLAIVALTAHAMAEDRARCEAAGCDEYATKPIDPRALVATCAAWMGRLSTTTAHAA
jgi:PAS domain S-box-containing protein